MRNLQWILVVSLMILSSCTYSINMIHTEGTATDVVDEASTPTAELTVTPNI